MAKEKGKKLRCKDDPSGKSSKLLGGVFACVVLGICGYFTTWTYALDEPTSLEEVREGLGQFFQRGKETRDEWDLGNFTNVLDDLDDFSFGDLFNEDPKTGDNTTPVWEEDFAQPGDGGPRLTFRNALDETWRKDFDVAVRDWQESDAMVLAAERAAVDHTCQRVDGVMVVCNDSFDATGWVEINERSVVRGRIASSVAKMNESYMWNADFAHRRFAMFHELGHGSGGCLVVRRVHATAYRRESLQFQLGRLLGLH